MKLFTKRLSSVLMLGLCLPFHVYALAWHMPHAWAAAVRVFASRIIKPILQIPHPVILTKINSTKVGIVASVGAALAAVCWVGWKKIVGRRTAVAHEKWLRQEREQQITALQEQLQQAQYSMEEFQQAKAELKLVLNDLVEKQKELNALRIDHNKLVWANDKFLEQIKTLGGAHTKKLEELKILCDDCEKLKNDNAQLHEEFKHLREQHLSALK